MKCKICGKEIKIDGSDPLAGIVIEVGEARVVFGIYHFSCLVKRLRELIEGNHSK